MNVKYVGHEMQIIEFDAEEVFASVLSLTPGGSGYSIDSAPGGGTSTISDM